MYWVFIKYCFFFEYLKIFRTLAFLCFPSVSVCVCVCGNNTIFNEHPVSGVMRRNMRGTNDIKGTVCQFTILAHVLLAEMMGLTDIQTIPLRHWSHF